MPDTALKLTRKNISRFIAFLERRQHDVSSLCSDDLHEDVASRMWNALKEIGPVNPGAKILDVGCGNGFMLKNFTKDGMNARGIGLRRDEIQRIVDAGFQADVMDQSFMFYNDRTFDVLWSRHCLEHSIMPYYTLTEYNRVLKSGGFLYVEVPLDGKEANHESNQNHYSIFGLRMWDELFKRTGFIQMHRISIEVASKGSDGQILNRAFDEWWAYFLRKAYEPCF